MGCGMDRKITAMVSDFRQTSYEEYRTFYNSKTFEQSATLKEIMEWAKTHKRDIKSINDIIFSESDNG